MLNHLCPYPDCASNVESSVTGSERGSQENVVPEIWDSVHLCCECGRVSFKCVHSESECHALNRPYVRYCSYCGGFQYSPALESNLTAVRKRVDEFDRTWEFRSHNPSQSAENRATVEPPAGNSPGQNPLPDTPSRLTAGSIVANLPASVFPKSVELISWAMVDGVLLIHQGSGGIAFVHAFQDANSIESDSTPDHSTGKQAKTSAIWSSAEAELLPAPRYWENPPERDEIDYAFLRPYPPVATVDRQFAVFSAPYGAFVVALAELPGWSSHGKIQPRILLKLGHRPHADVWLSAPPILIQTSDDHSRSSQLLGLLLGQRTSDPKSKTSTVRYYWQVLDLNQQETATVTGISGDSKPLALVGEPCQIHKLSNLRVLFSTPNGMWIASLNADTGEIQDLIELWAPSSAGDRIELDQHVLNRNNLVRQNLIVLKDQIPNQHALQRVTVWYRLGAPDGQQRIQCLSFNCQTADDKFAISGIQPLDMGAVPKDNLRMLSSGRYRGEAAYFLAGPHGELRCCPHGEQSPQTISQGFAGDVSEIKGVQVFDPLVVFVIHEQQTVLSRAASDTASPRDIRAGHGPEGGITAAARSIRLRTLASPKSLGDGILISGLEVDPLFWLSNLFVCERDPKGFLVIRRFDLCVLDHHKRSVPQPVHSVMQLAMQVKSPGNTGKNAKS